MNDRVIRVNEVAGILGVGKSTVWLWDREGLIPKSFKLTPSTTVWKLSAIMKWIDDKQKESYANPDVEKQGDIPNARHKKDDKEETPTNLKPPARRKTVKKSEA